MALIEPLCKWEMTLRFVTYRRVTPCLSLAGLRVAVIAVILWLDDLCLCGFGLT